MDTFLVWEVLNNNNRYIHVVHVMYVVHVHIHVHVMYVYTHIYMYTYMCVVVHTGTVVVHTDGGIIFDFYIHDGTHCVTCTG